MLFSRPLFFTNLGELLKSKSVNIKKLFPNSGEKRIEIAPKEPIALKFLYARENHKLEVHMELEWVPDQKLSRVSCIK